MPAVPWVPCPSYLPIWSSDDDIILKEKGSKQSLLPVGFSQWRMRFKEQNTPLEDQSVGLFSNYCGLGGTGPVSSATDLGCKIHDEAYSKYMAEGLGPYLSYVKADEELYQYLRTVESKSVKEEIARIGTMAYAKAKSIFPALPATWKKLHEGQL